MLSFGIEQVVVPLNGIPMKFEGSRHVQASRVACEPIRADNKITYSGSGYETKARISRVRVDCRGTRRRFHIVTIETKTRRIEQVGRNDVVLFYSHHLTQHWVVKEFGLVLVWLTL